VDCVYDTEYKTEKEAFQPLIDLCRDQPGLGELGIDKDFHYGFLTDEHNQYVAPAIRRVCAAISLSSSSSSLRQILGLQVHAVLGRLD
jgi:hypothetical protein